MMTTLNDPIIYFSNFLSETTSIDSLRKSLKDSLGQLTKDEVRGRRGPSVAERKVAKEAKEKVKRLRAEEEEGIDIAAELAAKKPMKRSTLRRGSKAPPASAAPESPAAPAPMTDEEKKRRAIRKQERKDQLRKTKELGADDLDDPPPPKPGPPMAPGDDDEEERSISRPSRAGLSSRSGIHSPTKAEVLALSDDDKEEEPKAEPKAETAKQTTARRGGGGAQKAPTLDAPKAAEGLVHSDDDEEMMDAPSAGPTFAAKAASVQRTAKRSGRKGYGEDGEPPASP